MTLTSTLVAADANGELVADPPPRLLKNATSVHVLAFSSFGDLLVIESEGTFSIGTWDSVYIKAEQVCRGHEGQEDDVNEEKDEDMDIDLKGAYTKEEMLRSIIQEQARKDQRWKQN